MNKQSKWIIFLVLLLVVTGVFIAVREIKSNCNFKVSNAYQQEINDFSISINNKIINELNSYGFVVFNVVQNNQTIPVRLGVIQNE